MTKVDVQLSNVRLMSSQKIAIENLGGFAPYPHTSDGGVPHNFCSIFGETYDRYF
tara:strand:+ start:3752 stop:3916 length:165 start_codon:yes stop_codon:yes gene_type:complete